MGLVEATMGRPSMLPVIVLPFALLFLAFACYIAFGRFIADRYIRRNTSFGVTNRRVIIAYRGVWPTASSIDPGATESITLKEPGNGLGTIKFSQGGWLALFSARPDGFWPSVPRSLEGIESPRDVYSHVLDLQGDTKAEHAALR